MIVDASSERLFAPHQTLHAPHLLDVEVAQVIRRYAANGEIDGDRGRLALTDLVDLSLRRYPHDFLLPRISQQARHLRAAILFNQPEWHAVRQLRHAWKPEP